MAAGRRGSAGHSHPCLVSGVIRVWRQACVREQSWRSAAPRHPP
jgi:hypothetical protein